MEDKWLLEAAAKAAGIEYHAYVDDPIFGTGINTGEVDVPLWNPLLDDAQALRLAVKLGLSVRAYPIYDEPKHSVLVQKSARIVDDQCVDVAVATCSYDDSDPYAATRRAIVRAAAEIGAMTEAGR